jgi:hypothetical protein
MRRMASSLRVFRYYERLGPLVAVLVSLGATQVAMAQDRLIEDIRVSRVGENATIEIQLACPMRFQADFPTDAGTVIEVRVAPFEVCRALGSRGEIRRPLNGRLAGLEEVEYEPLGPDNSLLMLRFTSGIAYEISQGGDLRTIVVNIDRSARPGPDRPPQPRAVPLESQSRPVSPGRDRLPLSPRIVEPARTADYMINLQSTTEPVDPSIAARVSLAPGNQLYVSRTQIDGQTWFRLRVGFFASESDARTLFESLRADFPRAWIGRAEAQEVESARDFALQNVAGSPLAVVAAETFEAESQSGLIEKPAAEIEAQMAAAREAMLEGNYEIGIQLYAELKRTAGEHRAEATEYLGLAYERAGLPNQARSEYEWYLREFPANVGIARVRQRLNGIVLRAAAPTQPLREVPRDSRWDTAFGISQYYRRDENQFDEDQESITTLSALISDIDLSVQRRGERFDMTGRMSVSHLHDMLDQTGPGDQERISYAYFDLESNVRDWWLRFGRQTLNSFGVLGRFDGARLDYTWSDQRIVHVMMGYPVESTRDTLERDREFYGAAVEFQDLIGSWDLSVFLNHQSIESLDARQAVGTEIRYSDSKRTLTGIVDFDVDYSELNTILLFGTWRLANRITLSALIDERKSPILTTRNALIGQPVGTIEELLLVWTEEEIRQLALDRTAESSTVTLGLAAPLGQRFQLNFDYTSTEVSGTAASGGVAAIESTGTQYFYSTSLVASGLFGSGDVSILNIRYGTSDQFKTSTFTWDLRIPVGRRIRVNPRIRLNSWKGLLNGRQRDSVSPTLRLLFNTRQHYRIEFEIGADRQTRVDGLLEREATGNFINLGYRANF